MVRQFKFNDDAPLGANIPVYQRGRITTKEYLGEPLEAQLENAERQRRTYFTPGVFGTPEVHPIFRVNWVDPSWIDAEQKEEILKLIAAAPELAREAKELRISERMLKVAANKAAEKVNDKHRQLEKQDHLLIQQAAKMTQLIGILRWHEKPWYRKLFRKAPQYVG